MAQADTNFPKVRRMLFCVSLLQILRYFWAASTLLHGHIALVIPSLLETDPQISEHWGYADEDHLGKSFQAMDSHHQDFVIEISVLYFFSPSSSTSDIRASISSDEFPGRGIRIRFLS